jgi:hypothetical protein
MEKKPLERVKMNLSLDKELFDKIKEEANNEYLKVGTWIRRYLMINLSKTNTNKTKKLLTKDEKK